MRDDKDETKLNSWYGTMLAVEPTRRKEAVTRRSDTINHLYSPINGTLLRFATLFPHIEHGLPRTDERVNF